MTDKKPLDAFELDALFDAARADGPEPSGDLMARIMADAQAQIVVPDTLAPSRGFLAGMLVLVGGWPAAAGLATATVVGLSVGLSTPDTLDTLTGGYLAAATGYDLDVMMPSYGDLLGEG